MAPPIFEIWCETGLELAQKFYFTYDKLEKKSENDSRSLS